MQSASLAFRVQFAAEATTTLRFRNNRRCLHAPVFPFPNQVAVDMNGILSLKTAQSHSAKDRLKISLGNTLAQLYPSRAERLSHQPTNYANHRRDRLIMAFLKEQARLNDDTRFFQDLHQEFWTGHGGAVFSSNCDHRFEQVFLSQQKQEFEKLKSIWTSGRFEHIVEIGCSSGLLIQFLTSNLPGVVSAIGIDINQTQIKANRKDPVFDSRIEFRCTDGYKYVCENAQPNTLFVTNGGVLEYFSRDQIDRMLSKLATEVGNSLFFSVEPIAPDHDWDRSPDSVPFGEELSFSHNYRDAFETNGFVIHHQRHVDFESWRWMATIAQAN